MLSKLQTKRTKLQKSDKGFTIIEVMIVLAIAGLILLIVFLAVPSLQRNARNTQRKSDASATSAAIATFISNNGGDLPALLGKNASDSKLDLCSKSNGGASPGGGTACTAGKPFESAKLSFYTQNQVFSTTFAPAMTVTVVGVSTAATATAMNIESMTIIRGAACDDAATATPVQSTRSAAVFYVTESASGDGTLQCVEQ